MGHEAGPPTVGISGLIRCDGDLSITEVGLTACRVLGRRREELLGRPLERFLDPATVDTLVMLTRRLVDRGLEVATVEAGMRTRSDALRPVQLTITHLPPDPSTLLSDDGSLVGAQTTGSFLVSLVPQARPGIDLAELEATASALAERAPDLIMRYRLWPERGFDYVSSSALELVGYPPSAFYADPDLLHKLVANAEALEQLMDIYDGVPDSHQPVTLHLVHRDGRVRAFEQRPTGIFDGERRLLAVECIAHDVTDRIEEQAELSTVLAIRRLFDELTPIDLDAAEPVDVLVSAVDAVCSYLDWPVGHAVLPDADPGLPSQSCAWHVSDAKRFAALREATESCTTFEEGDPLGSRVILAEPTVTPLGTVEGNARLGLAAESGLALAVTVPIPIDGGIGSVLEFFTDTTEAATPAVMAALAEIAVEVGRTLMLSHRVLRLRRLDGARQEFVARAAHELRGPVGSIAVMASALAAQARRLDTDALASSLESLSGQAERIRVMASRLLALSQLEQGRLELHLEVIEVRAACYSSVSALYPVPANPVHVDVDDGLKVAADAVLLDEVLVNLLVNASRHGGPTVRITAEARGDDDIAISVIDDGPGLSPRVASRLFEPLHQGLVTPEHGGLGLALVHQMVAAMGGTVDYTGQEPQGSCFTVVLPGFDGHVTAEAADAHLSRVRAPRALPRDLAQWFRETSGRIQPRFRAGSHARPQTGRGGARGAPLPSPHRDSSAGRSAPGGAGRPVPSKATMTSHKSWRIAILFPLLVGVASCLPVVKDGADPCAPVVTKVSCENSKPGTPKSQWDSGPGDASIQGFATETSVNLGETVHFKVNTPSTAYRLDIYRLGYYKGDGARLIGSVTPSVPLPQTQPPCLTDVSLGLVDCGNWSESASWTVPTDAVSGVFIAHLVRTDNGEDNQIPFVVRDDSSHSKVLFQTSDTTWQAYNDYGGYSLYRGPTGKAVKVSFNRPYLTRSDIVDGQDYLMYAEYPMIRFLEQNGYDLSYQSGLDTDRAGALLLNHKAFLSVGHDEYWSGAQRTNVEAARDAGVNLAFFSGNEVFWKIRYETAVDGSNQPYRTMVSYKETSANAKTDPTPTWTGTWRDPRFSPPSDGGRPENALTGTLFAVQNAQDPLSVPAADGQLRFWRKTSMATLQPGTTGTLPDGVLGYEWDSDVDNGSRPAGLFTLSSSTLPATEVASHWGTSFAPGTATHSLTTYRAASGALVFSAGTIQWSWGLDPVHDGVGPAANRDMRQATVNILSDMDAIPATAASGLSYSLPSSDHTAPTVEITSPAAGANVTNGALVTVTGTATDAGGGKVAAVEVSLDGGARWHRATGRETWSYTGSFGGTGAEAVRVRAVDDSGNLQSSPTVQPVNVACPCSIFGLDQAPEVPSSGDANSIEVGVRFTSDVDGWITGVRFYKSAANTGTHTGSLWSASGDRLADVTFTSESATGWQQADFPNAVPVTAGTTYTVSYHAPNGNYADDGLALQTTTPSGPLHAVADGTGGVGNGVYRYGASAFPTSSFQASNYWVDAVLATVEPPDVSAPTVTSSTPQDGASSIATTVKPTATFSEPVQPASISFSLTGPGPTTVSGSTSYDAGTRTATFTPSADLAPGTTYTATISGALDLAGNLQAAPSSWSFTTAFGPNPPGECPCTIWDDTYVPSVISENDASAVELGVRFSSDLSGTITGIRFYKGPLNTGTHTGTLWTAGGVALATATFAAESTTGWQQVTFDTPVPVTAGTTYVASYHTSAGHYSETPGQFLAEGVDHAPLHAPQHTGAAPNGVYAYGAGGFPSNSGAGTNYWVDVVFTPDPDVTPPAVVAQSPAHGSTSVPVTTAVSATMSERLQAGSGVLELTGPSGAVAGSVSYDDSNRRVSFSPSAPLDPGTTYTATLSAAIDRTGNPLAAPVSWTFTTSGPAACPCGIFSSSATPAVAASSDPTAAELGVRFTVDTDGWISGVRFYKGTANTGIHTGSLWTDSGSLLATATFSGESASGWQQVTFSAPVPVTAGTGYVASYYAPNGHYADDAGYFATATDNAPLHAPASGAQGNGVFRYGSSGFPTATFAATNYWVDVSFTTTQPPDLVAPLVDAVSPVDGSSSMPTDSPFRIVLNEAVNPATADVSVNGPSGAVAFTTSYEPSSFTLVVTPTAPLSSSSIYTVSLTSIADVSGNLLAVPTTWSVRSADPDGTPGVCPCTVWTDATAPPNPDSGDGQAVELGLKFRVDTAGVITGIRFFKAAANTGPHPVSLWTAGGTLLATATSAGESTAGWQTVTFTSPVSVSPGTTYVASYHTTVGHYSSTPGAFALAGVDRGPLHALQDGVDGPNGVFAYGAGGFPTATAVSTNYWVQPVYEP